MPVQNSAQFYLQAHHCTLFFFNYQNVLELILLNFIKKGNKTFINSR